MSKPIVRVGDKNNAGGAVMSGDNTVFVNGKPVAIQGSPVSSHPKRPPHTAARCNTTQARVFANGKPIILVNDRDTCVHSRVEGSPNVNAGS